LEMLTETSEEMHDTTKSLLLYLCSMILPRGESRFAGEVCMPRYCKVLSNLKGKESGTMTVSCHWLQGTLVSPR
jgi:hypothetical protein